MWRALATVLRRRHARTRQLVPAPRPPADYVPYAERRPVVVAEDLAELAGPTAGTVTLPHHLDWSGAPVYDLDNHRRLASMYRTVLAEARNEDDLRTWLNRERLIALWPDMFLPPKVRRLWEQRFPDLAATRTGPVAQLTHGQLIERVDLPGVVDVAGQWYGVTDSGRTLHVVVGEVRIGVRAVCGQKVDREAVPLDGNQLCRRCDRLAAPFVSTTS